MSPYAICLTDQCDYWFDFRATDDVPPRFPPRRCPICKGRIMFYCAGCRWPILTVPNMAKPCCGHCDAGLRLDGRLPKDSGTLVPFFPRVMGKHNNRVNLASRKVHVLKLIASSR
jgi:hypothetical protein